MIDWVGGPVPVLYSTRLFQKRNLQKFLGCCEKYVRILSASFKGVSRRNLLLGRDFDRSATQGTPHAQNCIAIHSGIDEARFATHSDARIGPSSTIFKRRSDW